MLTISDQQIAYAIECDVSEILRQELPWDKLAGSNIVVTGASGFIGSYFVRLLMALNRSNKIENKLTVTALVRDIERAKVRFFDIYDGFEFSIRKWDLSQIAVPDLTGAEYIIHAASQASPRFYGSDPVGTLLPNSVGTAALLEGLSRSNSCKGFLFLSSSEVYGSTPKGSYLTETSYGIVDPTVVRSCYAESKRVGEATCLAWYHQYGLPTYIARPFHTYGPGLLPEDGRVFADFAFNIVRGENILLSSDGKGRRAFCYITDALAGFFYVLLKGIPGTAYNVANPSAELSILELAELLIGLYPEKKLQIEFSKSHDFSKYLPSAFTHLIPDVSRLRSLGWHPSVTPEIGFRRMIQAYQQ